MVDHVEIGYWVMLGIGQPMFYDVPSILSLNYQYSTRKAYLKTPWVIKIMNIDGRGYLGVLSV